MLNISMRECSVDRTALTQKLLLIYSGALTILVAILVLGGFAPQRKKASFDEIDVKRLNIVESDGTVRLVVSNKEQFPGLIIKGKEYPHDRSTAGMLFFDDEGTESGGLIFGGRKDKNGKVQTWGHLSFDQYMQDQVLSIDAGEENGRRHTGIEVLDQPDYPISELGPVLEEVAKLPADQRQARLKELLAGKPKSQSRIFLGRTGDHSVALRLKDAFGKDRLIVMVKPDGSPILQLLDESGKVVAQLPEED